MLETPESEEGQKEKIGIGNVFQINDTLKSGAGISDEPFESKSGAKLNEVLDDAQYIANQTNRRVFFRFNEITVSVDKYMDAQIAGKEEEYDAIQKRILQIANELKDAGHRALTPEEESTLWQKESRKGK